MANGIVAWFDARQGRGGITVDDTGAEVPVRAAHIAGGGRQSLTEGDRVVFTLSDASTGAVAIGVYVP